MHPNVHSSTIYLLFFLTLFILFIYFWLHWVFISACGLSLVAASGGYSSLRCTCFSLRWLLLLWSTGSRHAGFSNCGSQALERRLSSCGAQAYLLRGMWDLPGPELEPMSPAWAGGFLTTVPPGKSPAALFIIAKTWTQPKCLSTDEWIKKMWYIYIQWNTTQP